MPAVEEEEAMAPRIAPVVNLVLAGMLTGNEFGSRVTAHPALRDLPLEAHILAEQALTRRYGKIMPVFMSSTLASFLPVLLLDRDRRSAPFRFRLAGSICYAAMLVITLTRNVPINNRLVALSPDSTPREELLDLTDRWARLHTIRNVLNVIGLTLTVLGATSAPRAAGLATRPGRRG